MELTLMVMMMANVSYGDVRCLLDKLNRGSYISLLGISAEFVLDHQPNP
jgi:hypothetical protein